MKIIQISPSYKPAFVYGGPTMSVSKLCEALVEIKTDIEVLTTTANGETELSVEAGKKVEVSGVQVTYFNRLTKDHTHFSPALLLALFRRIKKQRLTKGKMIIHIHSWWNLVTILSCWVAKMYKVPVVLSPRGMLTNYTQNNKNSLLKSTLHHFLGKSLLKYCHVIASSEQEAHDVLQIIQPKSLSILPNLVSFPLISKHTAQKIGQKELFKLLFFSRIEEKKGLDILFDSLAGLAIPWQLTIGGSGQADYMERLKLKAEGLKIEANINWLGQVNNEDKFELIAQYDLLLLTSHNENFANVVIESLSVGTPVLLSEFVGLSSYVLANDLGFVSKLNQNDITKSIDEAYHNLGKREKIRAEAPQIIKNDFDEKKLSEKYTNLYAQILNSN